MDTPRFSDVSFRDVYHRLVLVQYPVQRMYDATEKAFPAEADAALCYGYVDEQAGLTFEILVPACFADGTVYRDFDSRRMLNATYKIRAGALYEADAPIAFIANEQDFLDEYAEHIDIINQNYSVSDEYEQLRKDLSLDYVRHREFPDDVMVQLMLDTQTEIVWAHLEEANAEEIIVMLLNDPYDKSANPSEGDFLVAYRVWDEENNAYVLVSSPDMRLIEVDDADIPAPDRQLGSFTFRDMYGQALIVKQSIAFLFDDQDSVVIPEDADAALCVGTVSHTNGTYLAVLAPARAADAHVYTELADAMLEAYAGLNLEFLDAGIEAYKLDEYQEAALYEQLQPQLEHLFDMYAEHPDYDVLRADYALDPLRHKFYPDDVQIDLIDTYGNKERVWARLLEKIPERNRYFGYLLNQPHSDTFHLNIGSLVYASPHTNAEGEFSLITGPKDKVEGQEAYDTKLAITRELLREADVADLGTCEEDGAPQDEYDYEAYIAADSIPAGLSLDATTHMLSSLFTKSFETDFDGEKIAALAGRLQARWAQEGIVEDPANFDLEDTYLNSYFALWDFTHSYMNRPKSMLNQLGMQVGTHYTYHFLIRLSDLNLNLGDESE